MRQYFWTVVVGGGSLDLADLWHGIDAAELDRVRAHLERAIAERDDFELEHRCTRPDGSTGWVQQRGIVARDKRGNAIALRGIATDITDRRHAEHELRDELATAQRLLALTSKIPDDHVEAFAGQLLDAAVMIMRSDFASVRVYDPARDQLRLVAHRGFTPEAADHWRVVRRDTQTAWGNAITTGSRVVIADVGDDDPMSRRLGIRSVQSTPLMSRNFELLGVLSTHWRTRHEPTPRELRLFDVLARQATDVFERARTEDVLRTATWRDAFRTQLTEVLRTTSDPASIRAATSRLLGEHLQASRVYYADLDLETATCTMGGSYFRDGTVPLSTTFRLGALGQMLSPEFHAGTTAVSRDCRDAEGARGDMLAYIAVPHVKGGRLVGALAVQDATPRQWTADEIALVEETADRTWSALERQRSTQLEQTLRQNDQRKDELLATLAHELRSPLAPIVTGIDVLRLDPEVAVRDQMLSMMEDQVHQLVHLVDDLLDIARISQGKVQLDRAPIDLESLVLGAVDATRLAFDAAGHTIELALPEERIVLDADRTRIAQVLTNLLENAARYTPAGGRVVISAERADHEVAIRVRDNGVGMAPELLDRVFDIFVQGGRSQGLGIGLSLVKRVVELHGGSVRAFSDGPAQGSTFEVRLPVATKRRHAASLAVHLEGCRR